MEGMIGEIRAVAESMFLSGDYIYLGMVIVAALVGVFSMRNFGQIFCVSLLAMAVLGLIWLVYGGATSEAPSDPATYLGQLDAGWAVIGAMSGATLVGYLVTFAVAIGVLFVGKSLVFRG
jgi:hypothetical protein